MRPFAEILGIARARHGEALDERRARYAAARDPAAVPDDRALSAMTLRVFAAGFRWRVIEAKRDGFEAAFRGFDPAWCAALGAEELGALAADARIVRNPQKIATVPHNAAFVREIARAAGSFGAWVAAWPDDDVLGLLDALAARGARLGGDTGAWLLRDLGKGVFRLTADVTARLVAEGALSASATSKRGRAEAQAAFNRYRRESGLDHSALSVVLACSIDA